MVNADKQVKVEGGFDVKRGTWNFDGRSGGFPAPSMHVLFVHATKHKTFGLRVPIMRYSFAPSQFLSQLPDMTEICHIIVTPRIHIIL